MLEIQMIVMDVVKREEMSAQQMPNVQNRKCALNRKEYSNVRQLAIV